MGSWPLGRRRRRDRIQDRNGNAITLIRNTDADLTRIVSPHGRWIELSYDSSHRVTQAKDNGGRTVGYTYDASGRLWKVTDPANGVTEYTYDTSHRMLTLKDARGIVFLTNHYDSNGPVDLQTQADSTTFQMAYTLDAQGRVEQADLTDPRGQVRRVTFDAATGHLLTDTAAYGTSLARTTTWTLNGNNQVTRVTDGLGRHTDYAYDTAGNVTSVTRLAGTGNAVTTSYTYDATFWGRLLCTTNPLGQSPKKSPINNPKSQTNQQSQIKNLQSTRAYEPSDESGTWDHRLP
jgi:YD repeat-containing protein